MRAFKSAAGPNFGTYAFGALILALIEKLHSVARSQNGIASMIVSTLLSCIGHILEMINSFAVVSWGMDGVDSSASSHELPTSLVRLA